MNAEGSVFDLEGSGHHCLICGGNRFDAEFQATEMMFGTRDRFAYRSCADCESLTAARILDELELSRYYGPDYYSFVVTESRSGIREWVKGRRDRSHFGGASRLFSPLARVRPHTRLRDLARMGVTRRHRILDVGCGSGELLDLLARAGFRSLLGIDPFIGASSSTAHGAQLERKALGEVEDSFDVVMFHHTLEHVPNPQVALSMAASILNPGGMCIVRVPTPDSEAYRRYGASWVQIDPPRHVSLPSRRGFRQLARRAGFEVEMLVDDSDGFSFWGSEMVLMDVPFGSQSPGYRRPQDLFDERTLSSFEGLATACNAQSNGDQFAAKLVPLEEPNRGGEASLSLPGDST